MKKIHRLRKNEEFQEVFQRGRSYGNRHLILYCLPKTQGTDYRVGFSVSKKVGNAVVRNQVKRYLREAFRLEELNLTRSADFVLIARPSAAGLDYFETRDQLKHLLKKSGSVSIESRNIKEQTAKDQEKN